MESTDTPIVKIVLDNCITAHAFGNNEQIHWEEFKKACELINRQIKEAVASWEEDKENLCKRVKKCPNAPLENDKDLIRQHETISIFGNRGTGKTSFLYSILAEYRGKSQVEVLKIIDPTLIEEKGHFFLLLISLINEKVNEALTEKECEYNRDIDKCCPRKRWNKQLEKLAGGIPSLDGVGGTLENNSWQDKTYIMEKGLDSVSAAFHLEEAFHDLVKQALTILGKKVFIIAFDDIDVDLKKGWPVLEVIRKYLTTPYIITLLSGNMKLYAKNIRKQQWHNFGKELLINEAATPIGKQEYNTLVNEIEGQYLLKILKTSNRIHLRSLNEMFQIYGKNYCVIKNADEENDILLYDQYNKILSEYGIKNAYQQDAYRTYLMTLSLRTQIHFFRAHSDGLPEDISCIEVFLTRMYAQNIDVDLANNMPRKLLVVILRFLLRERIISESYQLQPTMENMDINSCLMGFSILFSQKVVYNPFLVFEYLIKIGCVRNFKTILDYEGGDWKGQLYTIDELCRYARMFQDNVLRNVMGNSIAYMEASNLASRLGYFALLGLEEKAHAVLTNRIDSVFKDRDLEDKVIGYMPLCIIRSGYKNEGMVFYSVYSLLATIGEQVYHVQIDGDVTGALAGCSQIKFYQMPTELGNNPLEEGNIVDWNDEQDKSSVETSGGLSELTEAMQEWVKVYKLARTPISAHLLGKISTRFFYAMNRIQSCSKDWKLGELMNRCIVAFMNAALIEETVENYRKEDKEATSESLDKLNLNNAIQDDLVFKHNLDFINRNKAWKCIPVSKWLFACPLLVVYLMADCTLLKDNWDEKLLESISEKYKDGHLAKILNRVVRKEKQLLGKFPGRQNQFDKTAQTLKDNGISCEFILKTNKQEVKSKLEEIFSEVPLRSITNFKKYLQNHPEKQW